MVVRAEASDWPDGPGEMARLVREHDWAGTTLGPPQDWSERLKAVVELMLASPLLSVLVCGPARVLLYNDAAARFFDARHPAALGQPLARSWPETYPDPQDLVERAFGGEAVQGSAWPLGGGPGRGRAFDLCLTPVRDADGTTLAVLVNGFDISARLRAETAARESEERFRAAVDALQGVIWTNDAMGRMSGEQPGWSAITGQTHAEYEGYGWTAAVHPDDVAPTVEAWSAAVAERSPFIFEHRVRTPGGAYRRFAIRALPLLGADGAVREWVGVHTDVTERHERQRRDAVLLALSDLLARSATAEDASRGVVALLGRELGVGRVLYAEVDEDAGSLTVSCEYLALGMSSTVGTYPLEGLGPSLPHYRLGRPLVVENTRTDPRTAPEQGPSAYEAAGTRALLDIPLVRNGRLVAILAVSHPEPRAWTGAEVDLVRSTAERCWDAFERTRAEQRIRELNATLEARVAEALAERKLMADVFEGTDAMISVADRDLRLLAFNRPYAEEVEKLGGHRPRVGDRLPDLYAALPGLAGPVEANWRRAVGGEVFVVTEEHGDPGRYRRSYQRRFEPIHDRDGRLMGAYQYATDVTERLRDQRRADAAEARRQATDARYRAYFQNSGELLFVVGVLPDGGFSFEEVNPAHRAALGFDVAAEPGRRIEEVLPPDAARVVAANYRRVVETGELQRYRETAELAGRVIHVETVLVPVRDETGRIVQIVGSGRDMTAQMHAEEVLRQSQKMDAMGQLTGGVAHDFNNLLTPILGGLDRLHRRGVGDDRDRRMIEGALQSAERARMLVQRLLAFARRQPLQPSAVDVSEVIHGMAELVASTTGPQIRISVEVQPDLPSAFADANQLEMAILNLAVNARDAMAEGGTLRISATSEVIGPEQPGVAAAPGRYVRLSVADTGIGMDEATLARAVEPFFSTKGIGRGTGLGLSMVHGLAAQLGGALTVQSKLGLGTNVELWLPVTEGGLPGGTLVIRDRAEEPPRSSGVVLLVDDEDLVRATAADMLAELGYGVVEAGSADEALSRVAEGLVPDIVVTDHLMPGLTGTELSQILQARRPGLPVLIISGYADAKGISPDLPRLTKPFRKDELAASLRGLTTAASPPVPG